MSRAPVLRKLLAIETLFEDEIYMQMGGDRLSVAAAINELVRAGELHPFCSRTFRSRFRLTPEAKAKAFAGEPA